MSLTENLKVTIVGSGSIGCFIGGHLLRHPRVQLLLYGRPRIKKAIDTAGKLTIHPADGEEFSIPAEQIPFTTNPQDVIAFEPDVVLITLKGTQIQQAFTEFGQSAENDVFPEDTIFVALQNGARSPDLVRSLAPKHLVIGGSVPYNIAMSEDAIFYQGTKGAISIERSESTRLITRMFWDVGLSYDIRANISAILYGKLVVNLNNAINALSGLPLLQELSQHDYRKLWANCIWESLAVYDAAGIKPVSPLPFPLWLFPYLLLLPDFITNFFFKNVFRISTEARSSMSDDFTHRRHTEIQQLNGEIVQLAEKYKASAPTVESIMWLVEEAQRRQQATIGGPNWRPSLKGSEIMSYVKSGIKENYPF